MVRSLFLRGLALIYLIAFASLLPQAMGLFGSGGILPVADFLDRVGDQLGSTAWLSVPTLAWLDSSDGFLLAMIWAGVALSIALFFRILPLPALVGLYVLYLSLDAAGQTFFAFQWDALLLETGFAAILLAPRGLRPSYRTPPSRVAIWVQRFLLFRLMLESGAVKLLSGDPSWRGLTALTYHYETQPLPTPVAWYVHQLPAWFHEVSAVGVFALELVVPFLFLMPRRLRTIGAVLTAGFQLLIAATGNYTFFNWLTIALCITLLDDADLKWLGVPAEESEGDRVRTARIRRWVTNPAGVLIIAMGVLQLLGMLGGLPLPRVVEAVQYRLQVFHIVNRYGLFAVMTTTRPEIVLEGSADGVDWRPYEFRYKPGDLERKLRWVAPYQPRLDWQMWFAALGSASSNPWFSRLVARLLEGSPQVLGLLGSNPFPDGPPRFIRALVYEYRFADSETRRSSGAIWTRGEPALYLPAVSLR